MACESAGDVFELLRAAVALIAADDGFRIPTQSARKALLLAERYLEWCTNDRNKQSGLQFAQELLAGLERCFLSQTSMKVRRERMWESYYIQVSFIC